MTVQETNVATESLVAEAADQQPRYALPKAVTLLLLSSLAWLLIYVRIETRIPADAFYLDSSWWIELDNQLRQGNLLGRDVFFTYGPLAQFIVSGGAQFGPDSSALYSWTIGSNVFDMLGIGVLALILLLIRPLNWSGALAIFSVALVQAVSFLRPLLPMLSMVVLVSALHAPPLQRRLVCLIVGLLWLGSQFITVELIVYSLAAGGALLGGLGLLSLPAFRRFSWQGALLPTRVYVEALVLCIGVVVVGNVLIELVFRLTSATYADFTYLRLARSSISGYNYTMGEAWGFDHSATTLLVAICIYAGFGLVLLVRQADSYTRHLLLGMAIAAAIPLKSGVIRGVSGQIVVGTGPLLLLFWLLTVLLIRYRVMLHLGLVLSVAVVAFWPWNGVATLGLASRLLGGEIALQERAAQLQSMQIDTLGLAPERLRTMVRSDALVVSFPYDNVIPIAMGRRTLAPVIQTYAAHDTALQQYYVQELERHRPNVEVIYGVDGRSAWTLGGVQNISRTPLIVEYLLEHFQLKTREVFRGGYVVLEPRPEPVALQREALAFRTSTNGTASQIGLSEPTSCALLELELTVRYPATALAGRPNNITLTVGRPDGTELQTALVPIEVGKPFSTLVYLGDPRRFYMLFGDRYVSGLSGEFDRLSIGPAAYDALDVNPTSIEVGALRCITQLASLTTTAVPLHVAADERIELVDYLPEGFEPTERLRPDGDGVFMHADGALELGPFTAEPDVCLSAVAAVERPSAPTDTPDGVEFVASVRSAGGDATEERVAVLPGASQPIVIQLTSDKPFTIDLRTQRRGSDVYDWSYWRQLRLEPCSSSG